MRSLGVAVAGTGFIGPVHVEALRRAGVTVTGILGSSPQKSEVARRKLGLLRSYADLEEILQDPAVSAVHLAVPNVLHFDMARRALLAGKHVMCEKPLAMHAGEADELVRLARQTGLHAGVCYNIRFYPVNLELRDRIRSGSMGRVYSVVGRYVQDWLLYDTDYNWRVLAAEGGALRAVSDIGTHWMDLVISITGLRPKAVFADLRTVHPVRYRPEGEIETFSGKDAAELRTQAVNISTEDTGCIILRFESGAQGVLFVSQVTAGRKNTLHYEISCAEGAASWTSERPNELWLGSRVGTSKLMVRDPAQLGSMASAYTDYPGGHNEGFSDTFKQCFRAFYQAILSGPSSENGVLYPTFDEGHHEIQLCDAILQSHKEQHWVLL